jgi:tRNA(fMet)-specific endonuclease VapC
MAWLLDTSVLIPIRDGDSTIIDLTAALGGPYFISTVSAVELESGVYKDPLWMARRRIAVDRLISEMDVIAFAKEHSSRYGDIIATIGYSRRKLLDRMIAAQALVLDATLVTLNPGDFADVPGLKLLAW